MYKLQPYRNQGPQLPEQIVKYGDVNNLSCCRSAAQQTCSNMTDYRWPWLHYVFLQQLDCLVNANGSGHPHHAGSTCNLKPFKVLWLLCISPDLLIRTNSISMKMYFVWFLQKTTIMYRNIIHRFVFVTEACFLWDRDIIFVYYIDY